MELSIFNLRQVKQHCKIESFLDLVEYFGVEMWDYDIIFGNEIEGVEPDPEIRVVNTLALDELIEYAVVRALELTGYVQSDAAKLLKITPRKLNYKIAQLGIKHPKWVVNN